MAQAARRYLSLTLVAAGEDHFQLHVTTSTEARFIVREEYENVL